MSEEVVEDVTVRGEKSNNEGKTEGRVNEKRKIKKVFEARDDSLKVVLKADTIGRLETLVALCDTLCNEGEIDVCYS